MSAARPHYRGLHANYSFKPKPLRGIIAKTGSLGRFGLTQVLDRMGNSEANTVAWIFLAVAFWDKHQVTRSEILHSADAINHAVPLESELQFAIRVLTEHGLVTKHGEFFDVTDSGRAMLESAQRGASNIFDEWKVLETAIASLAAV